MKPIDWIRTQEHCENIVLVFHSDKGENSTACWCCRMKSFGGESNPLSFDTPCTEADWAECKYNPLNDPKPLEES